MSFDVVSLYMHELALQARELDIRSPCHADILRNGLVQNEKLSIAHINAVSESLMSIQGLLSSFLAMDVFSIRCLPVFNFVRVAYAVVMLIKLYFSAAAPGSELGRIFDKDEMRAGQQLDALLDKFRATAADDRCRPAAKFLVVLVMLRSWFFKQVKADAKGVGTPRSPMPLVSASPAPQPPGDTPIPQPPDHPSTANTPLQLLSEVAAGSGASRSTPNNRVFPGWNGMRQPAQPFFQEGTDPATMPPPPTYHTDPPSADLAAAMAPVMLQPQGGYVSDANLSLGPGWDLESMGFGTGAQGMYEDGVRAFLDEPWVRVSDIFQGLPGPNGVFNF